MLLTTTYCWLVESGRGLSAITINNASSVQPGGVTVITRYKVVPLRL